MSSHWSIRAHLHWTIWSHRSIRTHSWPHRAIWSTHVSRSHIHWTPRSHWSGSHWTSWSHRTSWPHWSSRSHHRSSSSWIHHTSTTSHVVHTAGSIIKWIVGKYSVIHHVHVSW